MSPRVIRQPPGRAVCLGSARCVLPAAGLRAGKCSRYWAATVGRGGSKRRWVNTACSDAVACCQTGW